MAKRVDTQALKQRLDLRDVVEQFWGKPDYRSREYVKYRSPWREDHTPSFTVYPDHYIDYGDQRMNGDVYAWLMEDQKWDFKTALQWVRDRVEGYVPPAPVRKRELAPSRERGTSSFPSGEWQQAALNEVKRAEAYLWSEKPTARKVRHYLHSVRGLTDETIRRNRLGYNGHKRPLDVIDPESKRPIVLMPGIVIPWFNAGQLVAVHLRRRVGNLAEALGRPPETKKDETEVPKYTSLKGSRLGSALYNLDALVPEATVLIVEGEFDQMLAQQELDNRAIVVTKGGVGSRFTRAELQQLDLAGQVYSVFDNDLAGEGGAQGLAELGWKHLALKVPQGKDVTDFVVVHGGNLAGWLDRLSSCWWPGGVPDSVRSLALNAGPGSIAPVLELINTGLEQGKLVFSEMSGSDILRVNKELHFNIPERTLYDTLEHYGHLFLRKVDSNNHRSIDSNFRRKSTRKRGRPAFNYTACPREEIIEALLTCTRRRLIERYFRAQGKTPMFLRFPETVFEAYGFDTEQAQTLATTLEAGLKAQYRKQQRRRTELKESVETAFDVLRDDLNDLQSAPLAVRTEESPPLNAKEFRGLYLYAHMNARPADEGYSRERKARVLGTSPSALKSVETRAGIKTRLRKQNILLNPELPVRKQLEMLMGQHNGYIKYLLAWDGTAYTYFSMKDKELGRRVKRAWEQGLEVYAHMQLTSEHILPGDFPVSQMSGRSTRRSPASPSKGEKVKTRKKMPFDPLEYDPKWLEDHIAAIVEALGWERKGDYWVNHNLKQKLRLGDNPFELLAEILKVHAANDEALE